MPDERQPDGATPEQARPGAAVERRRAPRESGDWVHPKPAPAAAPRVGDAPAQELDRIRQLIAQGRDDEARQRLNAFRRVHPRRELPPELRANPRKP